MNTFPESAGQQAYWRRRRDGPSATCWTFLPRSASPRSLGSTPMTQPGSISVGLDAPDEQAAFDDRLNRGKAKLAFISNNYGCGWCVHPCDVEASKEAIDAIPEQLRTMSDWSEKGARSS